MSRVDPVYARLAFWGSLMLTLYMVFMVFLAKFLEVGLI